MVCAFANSPLSSSLVLYHSAAVGEPLPFSPVSSLWEPTFLKGGRRGEEERRGVGEKRKGKGGGVVAEKKERNLCPTPIASFYSPPPPLHKFSSLWLSPRIVDCAFLFLYSWRFPPPVFSRCFLFLPRFPPMCVDLLPPFLICCEERRRGGKGGEPPNSPPFPSSFLFFSSKWPQEGTYI